MKKFLVIMWIAFFGATRQEPPTRALTLELLDSVTFKVFIVGIVLAILLFDLKRDPIMCLLGAVMLYFDSFLLFVKTDFTCYVFILLDVMLSLLIHCRNVAQSFKAHKRAERALLLLSILHLGAKFELQDELELSDWFFCCSVTPDCLFVMVIGVLIFKNCYEGDRSWHTPTTKELEDYEDVCCVCLQEITTAGDALVLSCGHTYHKGCIYRWFGYNWSCPKCRSSPPVWLRARRSLQHYS